MTAIDCCKEGHPYTLENTRVTKQGWRQCRACDKAKAQAKRDADCGDRPKFKKKELDAECFRGHKMEGDNLYLYDTKWGQQRRCRACEEVRRQEKIAGGEKVEPTQTHCLRGHELTPDNISYKADGYSVCKQCAVARTMKHKNANYDEVLDRKQRNRRAAKDTVLEDAKQKILAIYRADLDDDELIRLLRNALPPAEQ